MFPVWCMSSVVLGFGIGCHLCCRIIDLHNKIESYNVGSNHILCMTILVIWNCLPGPLGVSSVSSFLSLLTGAPLAKCEALVKEGHMRDIVKQPSSHQL